MPPWTGASPSQVDVWGEAAAVMRLRAGRPDGGRRTGGVFLIVTVDSFLERKREVLRLSGDFPVDRD